MSTLILTPHSDDQQPQTDYSLDMEPVTAEDAETQPSGWTWLCMVLALAAAGVAGWMVRP